MVRSGTQPDAGETMNEKTFCFTIEIADIPAEIRCIHEANRTFFTNYLSDRTPMFSIEASAEDLEKMQQKMDLLADHEGTPRIQHSPAFLENTAIHELLAENLAVYDILLMHGSALAMDGEACIFTAPSGTGKSTHARLWREVFKNHVIMINDDKPLLKITDGGTFVYGTPWDGKHHLSSNCSAPLKAVIQLTRSPVNHIEPLDKASGFIVLMEQIYLPVIPENKARITGLMRKLLNTVSFYHLGCNMEPDAAICAWNKIYGKDQLQQE